MTEQAQYYCEQEQCVFVAAQENHGRPSCYPASQKPCHETFQTLNSETTAGITHWQFDPHAILIFQHLPVNRATCMYFINIRHVRHRPLYIYIKHLVRDLICRYIAIVTASFLIFKSNRVKIYIVSLPLVFSYDLKHSH